MEVRERRKVVLRKGEGNKDYIRGIGYCFWNGMRRGKADGGEGEMEGSSAERVRE